MRLGQTINERDVIIPDVITGMAKRINDKTQPQWVRDNNKRTLIGIRDYLDKVLKNT